MTKEDSEELDRLTRFWTEEAERARREEFEKELKEFPSLLATRDTAEGKLTFDFEGVSEYIKSSRHMEAFRASVTGAGITPYLPVSQQAALAKRVVALAADNTTAKGKPDPLELTASGQRLLTVLSNWPKGTVMPISGEFRDALTVATKIINNGKL